MKKPLPTMTMQCGICSKVLDAVDINIMSATFDCDGIEDLWAISINYCELDTDCMRQAIRKVMDEVIVCTNSHDYQLNSFDI